MAKTDPLAVRLDPDVREALDRMAAEEERSLSYLINRAVRRNLREFGLLPWPTEKAHKEPKR